MPAESIAFQRYTFVFCIALCDTHHELSSGPVPKYQVFYTLSCSPLCLCLPTYSVPAGPRVVRMCPALEQLGNTGAADALVESVASSASTSAITSTYLHSSITSVDEPFHVQMQTQPRLPLPPVTRQCGARFCCGPFFPLHYGRFWML